MISIADAFKNSFAKTILLDFGNKIASNIQTYICVEQSKADLAHGIGNIALAQAGLTAELLEYFTEFITQIIEHELVFSEFTLFLNIYIHHLIYHCLCKSSSLKSKNLRFGVAKNHYLC